MALVASMKYLPNMGAQGIEPGSRGLELRIHTLDLPLQDRKIQMYYQEHFFTECMLFSLYQNMLQIKARLHSVTLTLLNSLQFSL